MVVIHSGRWLEIQPKEDVFVFGHPLFLYEF